MTTDSGDAGSTPVGTTGETSGETSTESPYGIGAVPDEDAAVTGPKPLDTELEDEQVEGEA